MLIHALREVTPAAALLAAVPPDIGPPHVSPGATGEIVWQFTRPGEFEFACLQPGRFEAGMVGKVTVK